MATLKFLARCPEKLMMSDLILGVIMDILVHVFIQHSQRIMVGWVPATAWNFAVLDASEFVVLDPKVGLKNF